MPSTYAHYYFGEQVLNNLPEEYKEKVKKYRSLFDVGVHGPDIFFYYEGYKKNNIVDFGYKMHLKPAKEFFERCKKEYLAHEDKDEMLVYILGFLAHFTLDSCCHSYVERKREFASISHNKVESEYERHLLVKNGYSPTKYDRTQSLKPSKRNAHIISYFFDFDEETIYKTLKWQVWILKALSAPNKARKIFIDSVINIAKISSETKDLVILEYEDEICKDSNIRLDKYREKAVELYKVLFNNLINYFEDKEELSSYFNHHFDKWDNYQDIPVLNYEEEINYQI